MLFHRNRAEYTDGEIDLIPLHFTPANREMGFGREQIWRITLHDQHREIGQISYRAGESRYVYYYGHIGYHIDPPWRGHHYARSACQLIVPEIDRSGKSSVVITCDPDNVPSRKTCEALGCLYERTVPVPEDIREKYEIGPVKRRYIWRLRRREEGHDGTD